MTSNATLEGTKRGYSPKLRRSSALNFTGDKTVMVLPLTVSSFY